VLPRGLSRLLIVAWLVVAGAGLAIELVASRSDAAAVDALLPMLSLSYEENLPTWYSSCLLFAAGLLLSQIALSAWQDRDRFRWHWWLLAAGFFYMSLDEAAEIHENLGGLVGGSGVFYFDWVIPAGALVLVLGVIYLPFLRGLPAPSRGRFVLAAALYLGGALVMELPLGWWTQRAGYDNLTYALIDWVEEALEIAGASLFVVSLAAHRSMVEEEAS